jgi:hypothetical protein
MNNHEEVTERGTCRNQVYQPRINANKKISVHSREIAGSLKNFPTDRNNPTED